MWRKACFILVSLCLIELQCFQFSTPTYKGYVVCRVTFYDANQARMLSDLKNVSGIDFWSEIDMKNHCVNLMVAPEKQNWFTSFLKDKNMNWTVIIEDLEKISEMMEQYKNGMKCSSDSSDGDMEFISQYMSYKQIRAYVESLPNKATSDSGKNIAEIELAGKSSLGEDVIMIKISSDHGKNKPIVFMEAAMHAREWAGPPTLLYLVQQLVENYTANKDMLENLDFYIIPVSNPDGYEYTREKDRYWRKTRTGEGECIGVDGNRNFDHFWGVAGASSEPCSEIYMGPKPFSEAETQNIRDVAMKYKSRLLGYVAVHTYGGYLLYPWGYTKTLPDNWENLDTCATSFVKAVEQYNNTKYIQGTSARLLYEAAGGSDDYMMGKLNVSFAYTLEIASSDDEGFHMKPERLPSVGAETFQGFKALAECFWQVHTSGELPNVFRFKRGWYKV